MKFGRTLIATLFVALIAAPASAGASRAERGEQELAKMLDGRVPGAPEDCIRDFAQEGMQVVDGVGFVFRRGKTLWVNRPANAEFLDDSDLPVFEKWGGSSLCRLDHVSMRDRTSLIPGPTMFLAEFVPYTRDQ